MSVLKTTLTAASIALVAVSSASAAQNNRRTSNAEARGAYAAQYLGERHPGNIASDTSREGLVQTNQ